MKKLYFQFLQTVAAFVVKATKIDADKDGKIEGNELLSFFTSSMFPLIMNIGGLKEEVNAFVDHVQGLTFEEFRKDLLDLMKLQLLPDELSAAEAKLDKILGGVSKLIEGGVDVKEGFADLFGGGDKKGNLTIVLPKQQGKTVVKVKAN